MSIVELTNTTVPLFFREILQFLQPTDSDMDLMIELEFYVTMPEKLSPFKERIALLFGSRRLGYFKKIATMMNPVW